jgi:hypothetical protein
MHPQRAADPLVRAVGLDPRTQRIRLVGQVLHRCQMRFDRLSGGQPRSPGQRLDQLDGHGEHGLDLQRIPHHDGAPGTPQRPHRRLRHRLARLVDEQPA